MATSRASPFSTPVIENTSRPVSPSDSRVSPGRNWSGSDPHHQEVERWIRRSWRRSPPSPEEPRPSRSSRATSPSQPFSRRTRSSARPRRGTARRPRRSSPLSPMGDGSSRCPPTPERGGSEPHVGERRAPSPSWFPRREPYELKSARSTPWPTRYFPAGESGLIEPAGDVVCRDESPSETRQRAPWTSSTEPMSGDMPSKYGGRRTYVEPSPRHGDSP